MKNAGLDWSHKDPPDRTIAATTLRRIPFVSSDRAIGNFYPKDYHRLPRILMTLHHIIYWVLLAIFHIYTWIFVDRE